MYASVADDYAWFDSWPGVSDLPHWERPLKLNYGDDSVMTREDKQVRLRVLGTGAQDASIVGNLVVQKHY